VNVSLTPQELRLAATCGVERRLSAMEKGRQGAHGFDRDDFWGIDIEGLAAEWAVAKALGVYYSPVVGHLDTDEGDVIPGVQVRSSKHAAAHLLMHKTDHDEHRFILVTGACGHYRIAGWVYGVEGKEDRFWREYRGRTAYWVPQNALRTFEPKAKAA
jgi:hypothetical protein